MHNNAQLLEADLKYEAQNAKNRNLENLLEAFKPTQNVEKSSFNQLTALMKKSNLVYNMPLMIKPKWSHAEKIPTFYLLTLNLKDEPQKRKMSTENVEQEEGGQRDFMKEKAIE